MSRSNIESCPFCRVRSDEVFAESEHFVAIYNLAPILPGHSLVIPKEHVESLMDLSRPAVGELMIFSRDVAELLGRAFCASGFNWTIQEKEQAGQTVPHLHVHIIPRKSKDLPEPGAWYPLLRQSESELIDSANRPRLQPAQIRVIVEHIKQFRHTR